MVRALTTLALSVLLLTGAHAQSVPAATSKKATAQASRAARKAQRATSKAQRVAARKAAKAKVATADGWPPLEVSAPVVASAATDATYGAGPSASPYGRDNVYAAPGMPVNIRFSKQAVPYSVRPPRQPAHAQTTLTNGR